MDAVLAERDKLRAEVERLTAERDAYRRAKQENDERFMNERDDARGEVAAIDDSHRAVGGVLQRQRRPQAGDPAVQSAPRGEAVAGAVQEASEEAMTVDLDALDKLHATLFDTSIAGRAAFWSAASEIAIAFPRVSRELRAARALQRVRRHQPQAVRDSQGCGACHGVRGLRGHQSAQAAQGGAQVMFLACVAMTGVLVLAMCLGYVHPLKWVAADWFALGIMLWICSRWIYLESKAVRK